MNLDPTQFTGEYLSLFTDRSPNGTARQNKSNAVITVDAAGEICGTDKTGSIAYELTGRVVRGYLTGLYRSMNDGGVGTFFFEPKGPHTLNGMWQGWSGDINRLDSGVYVLRRKLEALIRHADSDEDVRRAHIITDSVLGEGYSDPTQFGSRGLLVAVLNSGIIAGCLTYEEGSSSIRTTMERWSEDNQRVQRVINLPNSAMIRTIAVDPQFAGHGIGHQLLRTATDLLHAEGIRNIVMTGWQPLKEERPRVAGIAEDLSYRMLFTIPAFWHADSVEKNYKCPSCGHPCCCAAGIYVHQSY